MRNYPHPASRDHQDLDYLSLPPRFQAFKGEVSRILLDALREAKAPLPVFDLTLTVAATRAISTDDKPFMIILRRRVDACLRNLRKRGLVRSTRPSGSLTLWEIKPPK